MVAGWPVGEHGVVLRLHLSDGATSQQVTFAADGRVVHVADTSVFASTEDFTTWRLTRSGLRRVLRAFDDLGVREAVPGSLGETRVGPGLKSVGVFWGEGQVVSGSVPLYDDGGASPGQPLWDLAEGVARPSWHGRHVVAAPRPWLPQAVGVTARRPNGLGSPVVHEPFRAWPLARRIPELSEGTTLGADGSREHRICLVGRDAARVFRLMQPGTNHAWLQVDDGRRWEIALHVVTPAYVVSNNPCGGGIP